MVTGMRKMIIGRRRATLQHCRTFLGLLVEGAAFAQPACNSHPEQQTRANFIRQLTNPALTERVCRARSPSGFACRGKSTRSQLVRCPHLVKATCLNREQGRVRATAGVAAPSFQSEQIVRLILLLGIACILFVNNY